MGKKLHSDHVSQNLNAFGVDSQLLLPLQIINDALGGFLIGVTEILVTSVWSDFAYGFCFLVLVIVLLFKPEGLLGKPMTEKV